MASEVLPFLLFLRDSVSPSRPFQGQGRRVGAGRLLPVFKQVSLGFRIFVLDSAKKK